MKKELTFADQLNKRKWWHSPPADKAAYKKRGIFLASSYKECELYGRPLNEPIRVRVFNPLVGTEENIISLLFGNTSRQIADYVSMLNGTAREPLKVRFKLDNDLFKTAKSRNYDSIAIISEKGIEKIKKCKLPKSVELNILNIENGILK